LQGIIRVAVIDFLSTETEVDSGKEVAKQIREELEAKHGLIVRTADETNEIIAQIMESSQGEVFREGEYFQKVGRLLDVDAIFGGSVEFTTNDRSGWVRKEFTDSRTGAQYYRDVWVDRVGLFIEMETYIVRVSDGDFMFKEKFSDETIFDDENSSTSLYGFFNLMENQVTKLLSHLSPKDRSENRYLLQ